MPSSGSHVTQHLLSRFYHKVERLPEYLTRILPEYAKPTLEQAFGVSSSSTEQPRYFLDSSLERLTNSLVGSRLNGIVEEHAWCDWNVPSTQDAWSGGSMVEVRGGLQRISNTKTMVLTHLPHIQLVQQAQTRILRAGRGSRASSNILTLGYREADDRIAGLREVRMTGSMAITNFYVNPHVTSIILGAEWQHLLKLLGPAVILHLLTSISLFTPIPGNEGNLLQILGTAMADLPEITPPITYIAATPTNSRKRKRSRQGGRSKSGPKTGLSQPSKPAARVKTLQERSKSDSAVVALQKAKREGRNTKSAAVKPPVTMRKASEIEIARNRIYYARPIRLKSGRVAAGLPIVHIFNRSTPKEVLLKRDRRKTTNFNALAYVARKQLKFTVDKKTIQSRARKVIKYIWPKEFGLHNILTSEQNRWKTREKWEEYTNREDAIRTLGPVKTPKRLQIAARLVSIMLAKHDRLDYGKLLRYCCPSSLPSSRLSAVEREEIALTLSEPMIDYNQIQTQTQLPSADLSESLQGVARSQGSTKKPAFTKYKAPAGSVSRFVQAVLRQVLPIELLGSHHNLRIVLKSKLQVPSRCCTFKLTRLFRR